MRLTLEIQLSYSWNSSGIFPTQFKVPLEYFFFNFSWNYLLVMSNLISPENSSISLELTLKKSWNFSWNSPLKSLEFFQKFPYTVTWYTIGIFLGISLKFALNLPQTTFKILLKLPSNLFNFMQKFLLDMK